MLYCLYIFVNLEFFDKNLNLGCIVLVLVKIYVFKILVIFK